MELSDPATPDPTTTNNNATNRRKSTRTKQKPILLQEDPYVSNVSNGSTKRKRAETRDEDSADQEDIVDESSMDESDGDPDEEELKEKRRRAPKPKKPSSKPVAKKPKTTNAPTTKLAVRPATNGAKNAPKPKKARARSNTATSAIGTGLYGTLESMISSALPLLIAASSRSILSSTYAGRSCGGLDDAL